MNMNVVNIWNGCVKSLGRAERERERERSGERERCISREIVQIHVCSNVDALVHACTWMYIHSCVCVHMYDEFLIYYAYLLAYMYTRLLYFIKLHFIWNKIGHRIVKYIYVASTLKWVVDERMWDILWYLVLKATRMKLWV